MLIYRQLKKRKERKLKEQQNKKKEEEEEGKMGNKQGSAAGAGKATPNYKGKTFCQLLRLSLISCLHPNCRRRCEHFEHWSKLC
jgi:hypothetical protein